MIVGVDTDVLVHWAMSGAPHHRAVREYFERAVERGGGKLGLTPQVIHEFLHVATDSKRFERPLAIREAVRFARGVWDAKDVERILPAPSVVTRTFELLESLRLGRKRILDTALAATLEAAGVKRLVTLNTMDYDVFDFLVVESPL